MDLSHQGAHKIDQKLKMNRTTSCYQR